MILISSIDANCYDTISQLLARSCSNPRIFYRTHSILLSYPYPRTWIAREEVKRVLKAAVNLQRLCIFGLIELPAGVGHTLRELSLPDQSPTLNAHSFHGLQRLAVFSIEDLVLLELPSLTHLAVASANRSALLRGSIHDLALVLVSKPGLRLIFGVQSTFQDVHINEFWRQLVLEVPPQVWKRVVFVSYSGCWNCWFKDRVADGTVWDLEGWPMEN